MNAKDLIKNSLTMSNEILNAYLGDLEDADLMVRAVPGTNHAAWQLGHLISSERHMLTGAGVTMPALPDGFEECYTKETSASDDASKFHKKGEYLTLMEEQRKATLAGLEAMSDADLDRPTPEEMHAYAGTVGIAFNMVAIHVMMHAPQLVAIRRKLGKPIVI